MTAVKHITKTAVADLPFVRDRAPSEKRRCFWSVEPTGDYLADNRTGARFGLAYLAYLEADRITDGCLSVIVSDMPRGDLSGIEIGFLRVVANAAKAGGWRARQIEAWYASQEAARATKPARGKAKAQIHDAQ